MIPDCIMRGRVATGHLYSRAVPSHMPNTQTSGADMSVAAVSFGEGAYAPIKMPAWLVRRVR